MRRCARRAAYVIAQNKSNMAAILLQVIDLGYADSNIQVPQTLRSAYVNWYLRWSATRYLIDRKRDVRLHLFATLRRDAKVLAGLDWLYKSDPLEHIKRRVGECGDADALRWLLKHRQGLRQSILTAALTKNDMAIVNVIVEHLKALEMDLASCMTMIGEHGAATNNIALVAWALAFRPFLAFNPMKRFLYTAAINGHVAVLQYCLQVERVTVTDGDWNIICKDSHQYPLVQAALREAGCPCICAK
jgi:hypothetical protein